MIDHSIVPRYRADERVPYFCTLTILDWLPVFIDPRYIEVVIDSLKFCREKKDLRLFGYVIMPNHLHLIAGANDLHTTIREFKSFTSRTIRDRLREEGRRSIIGWLNDATEETRKKYQSGSFWKSGFHPQAIYTIPVFRQKLEYLHNNPVRKGFVRSPVDWFYSSAGNYEGVEDVCLEIDSIEDWM